MSRRTNLFLEDMGAACRRVLAYRDEVDWDDPSETPMALDALLHNLLVLGEAAKQVPADVSDQAPEIEWRKIAGLRDVLAHGYFRIDLSIIRDVAYRKLDVVAAAVERLLAEL